MQIRPVFKDVNLPFLLQKTSSENYRLYGEPENESFNRGRREWGGGGRGGVYVMCVIM